MGRIVLPQGEGLDKPVTLDFTADENSKDRFFQIFQGIGAAGLAPRLTGRALASQAGKQHLAAARLCGAASGWVHRSSACFFASLTATRATFVDTPARAGSVCLRG